MAALTRRLSPDCDTCWHIYYGDVRVGTIAARGTVEHNADAFKWDCGFYPGTHGTKYGSSKTFDMARADFEKAWIAYRVKLTEAAFQEWRDHRDWTARKYAAQDRGEKQAFTPCNRNEKSPDLPFSGPGAQL